VVFDHPSPHALAQYMLAQLGPQPDAGDTTAAELMALLARMEQTVALAAAGAEFDNGIRSTLLRRLRALEGSLRADAAADGVADLDSADDSELFSFIDGN